MCRHQEGSLLGGGEGAVKTGPYCDMQSVVFDWTLLNASKTDLLGFPDTGRNAKLMYRTSGVWGI